MPGVTVVDTPTTVVIVKPSTTGSFAILIAIVIVMLADKEHLDFSSAASNDKDQYRGSHLLP